MPLGLPYIRAVAPVQPPPRLPPLHRLQDPLRLLAADLQQRRVRAAAVAVRQSRVRGRLRADQDVHDPDELRQGVGRGVPQAGRDQHALLDRDTPARGAAVAGQGADADGVAAQRHKFRLVNGG